MYSYKIINDHKKYKYCGNTKQVESNKFNNLSYKPDVRYSTLILY